MTIKVVSVTSEISLVTDTTSLGMTSVCSSLFQNRMLTSTSDFFKPPCNFFVSELNYQVLVCIFLVGSVGNVRNILVTKLF